MLIGVCWDFNIEYSIPMQENAEQTALFLVLINLLHPLDPSRWLSPTSNESIATRKEKFSDLVIKCLFRLTKVSFLLALFGALCVIILMKFPWPCTIYFSYI